MYILYLDGNGKCRGYNKSLTKEEILDEAKSLGDSVFYDLSDDPVPPMEDDEGRVLFVINGKIVYKHEEELKSTQLDRVEQALSIKNDELRQEGADMLAQELIERGIL